MRDTLIQYISLLFAGAPECEQEKQAVLQNALQHYDALMSRGESAEAAYRQVLSGIGDVRRLLGKESALTPDEKLAIREEEEKSRKFLRATAYFLYILCPIPLVISAQTNMLVIGLIGQLFLACLASAMLTVGDKDYDPQAPGRKATPAEKRRKRVGLLIHGAGLAMYFLLLLCPLPRYFSWLVFPVTAAVWCGTKYMMTRSGAETPHV